MELHRKVQFVNRLEISMVQIFALPFLVCFLINLKNW